MKAIAATLILVDSIAGVAAGSLLSRAEGALWLAFVVAVSVAGYVWALRDRAALPETKQEELRHMGYVPSVTSSLSLENAKRFCSLLGAWLACFVARIAIHYA